MSMSRPTASKTDAQAAMVRKVELAISGILRGGVLVSLLIVVAGLVLSFMHHPEYLHSSEGMTTATSPTRHTIHTFGELVSGLREWRGEAVIAAGLLLLILTPVLRVAVSIVGFVFERDWKFVMITSFVLLMLVLSFVLGKAGG
jgi:uncharacterized membrane protein